VEKSFALNLSSLRSPE